VPIYEFTCQDCGLRFEKLFRRISDQPEAPCECGGVGLKQVTAAAFAFNHPPSQTRGALPPNTGTSDDWKFDKAIGRDAEEKWSKIEERGRAKDKTVQQERHAGRLVTRDHLVLKHDGSGEYRVISEPERVRANQNREAAFKIAQAAKNKSTTETG
jgi:putative FmdB family regulatory protein